MKISLITLVCLGCAAFGAEPVNLPLDLGTFKTLDNKVYEETKVIGSDAVGIKIMHAGGTARITYDRLPRELAAKFEVKPGAAEEQLRKEAEGAAAHEREMELAEKPVTKPKKETADDKLARLEEGDESVSVWDIEIVPEAAANTPASGRIAALEAYVARAKNQIAEMEKEVTRLTASEARAHAKATYDRRDTSNNRDRADFRHARVLKQQEKIAEVHRRMTAAEREIKNLR